MSSLVGFEQSRIMFSRLIKNGNLAHAYLFSGPDMIGKRLFALELCELLNGRPADENNPDFFMVAADAKEGESNIPIERIRALKSFLSLRPYYGPYRCIVIDEAHQLTIEASNALLKTLEEPQLNVIMFLISSQPKALLPTIASRCQEISCAVQRTDVIEEVLKKHKIKGEDATLAAQMAAGRLGWAMRLAESGVLDNVKQSVVDLQSLARKGIAERMSYAKQLADRDDCREYVEYWLRWVHTRLASSDKAPAVLRRLLRLHHLLGQPQYNHRLAIENFLINL